VRHSEKSGKKEWMRLLRWKMQSVQELVDINE